MGSPLRNIIPSTANAAALGSFTLSRDIRVPILRTGIIIFDTEWISALSRMETSPAYFSLLLITLIRE